MRKNAVMMVLAAVLAGVLLAPARAQEPDGEYQIKALLLSKIVNFVSWPGETNAVRQLCVAGTDPFGAALDAAFAKSSQIELRRLDDPAQSVDACDLVYISPSEQRDYQQLLQSVADQPVLTVSDIPRFANNGGMINLALINRRVRFFINQQEIERSGMRVSYKLLRLADIVRTDSAKVEKQTQAQPG